MKKRLMQLREWQRLVMLLEHEITFNVTLPGGDTNGRQPGERTVCRVSEESV